MPKFYHHRIQPRPPDHRPHQYPLEQGKNIYRPLSVRANPSRSSHQRSMPKFYHLPLSRPPDRRLHQGRREQEKNIHPPLFVRANPSRSSHQRSMPKFHHHLTRSRPLTARRRRYRQERVKNVH